MPTYAQLQAEAAWGAEFQPPSMAKLCADLRAHYGVTASALGSKGNNLHLRGYHRSRNWIRTSVYCTDRTYSVSRTAGDRAGGDGNWLCAIDATLPTTDLLAACKRLDAAVRAGRLEKITEWYGNTDGDQRVDGYDNIANVIASSDSSHLWHLHMSFDRGRAGEDHSDLYAILTGTEGDDDMDTNQNAKLDGVFNLSATVQLDTGGGRMGVFPVPLTVAIKTLAAKLDAIGTKVDTALTAIGAIGHSTPEVAAILAGLDQRLAATRTALETELRDAVADLGEGGAAQVRADA